ncbi:MAG: DUF2752 domain-containing protein [Prevotella sp.]|nr:DUF2752 domain-containing protein [Prevotella sp.]
MKINLKHIVGAAMLLSAPVLLLKLNPKIEFQESLCPFMRYAHFPCPGCGLTKSLVSLVQGKLLTSLSYHPFGFVVEIVAIVIIIFSLLDFINGTYSLDRLLDNNILWKIFSILFLIFYLFRLVNYFIYGKIWFL